MSEIIDAIRDEDYDTLREILDKKNINDRFDTDELSDATPLMIAASLPDNIEMIKFLIDHGANLNKETEEGETALHIASRLGNLENVRALIDFGGNKIKLDAKDDSGYTPLMIALIEDHFDIVRLLVEAGAKADLKVRSIAL